MLTNHGQCQLNFKPCIWFVTHLIQHNLVTFSPLKTNSLDFYPDPCHTYLFLPSKQTSEFGERIIIPFHFLAQMSQQIQIILTNERDLASVRVRYLASNIFDAKTLFHMFLTQKQQELFIWVKNICPHISMHWAEIWFSVLILCENPLKW